MKHIITAPGAALAIALSMPGAAAANETHFVGQVTDELFVGIAVATDPANPERRAIATYLCDSENIWHMHGGIVEGDAAELADGRMNMDIAFGEEMIVGSLEIDGIDAAEFQAMVAVGNAGLYLYNDPDQDFVQLGPPPYTGGWIILNSLDQRGAITYLVDGSGTPQWTFPQIDPATGTVDTEVGRIQASANLNLSDCFTGGLNCPLN